MTLIPPRIAPRLKDATNEPNSIRAAHRVLGPGQWQEMAKAANWLAGVGGSLGSLGATGAAISAGSSQTWKLYCWPRSQHTTWFWSVQLKALGISGGHGTVTLNPGGTTFDFTLEGNRARNFGWTHVPSSVAAGEVSIQISVNAASPHSVMMMTVGVYELPRYALPSTGGTAGVLADSCGAGQVIYQNTTTADKYSVQGVYEQIRDAKDNCRRQALFNWYSPAGYTTASLTYVNLFRIPPAVQTRHLTNGETVRAVTVAINGLVTGGTPGDTGGELLVTAATGDTLTFTYDGATSSATWATGSIDVETDDFSQSNLIRGGTRDTLTFQLRRTNSSSSFTVYGVSVGESG